MTAAVAHHLSPEPTCPSPEELRLWLDGKLEPENADPIEQHANDCPKCLGILSILGKLSKWHEGLPNLSGLSGADPDRPLEVPGYKLLGELGRGGMGIVYRARRQADGQLVALKTLQPTATPEAGKRFAREVAEMQQLVHPHIVAILDAGEEHGRPWFAMELLDKGNLQVALVTHPTLPSPLESARLVWVLAQAVQVAHARGVVHRDLKPANVLLGPLQEGEQGTEGNTIFGFPKVADFGLVKRLDALNSSDGSPGCTSTGQVLGTPQYMAPEQATGSKDVGAPADVWALGVLLYRCLTGRLPFEGEAPLKVLRAILDSDVEQEPLRHRQVPRALQTICLCCLRKDPSQRYATAGELATDLHRFLQGKQVQPPKLRLPQGSAARRWAHLLTGHWFRRILGGAVGTGLMLLVVVGVVRWNEWGRRSSQHFSTESASEEAQAQKGTSSTQSVEVQAEPKSTNLFRGYIDVILTRPRDPRLQLVRLNDPGCRPLQEGDELRVVARLNRAGYPYILWIDTEGQVGPVYPWVAGNWKKRRSERAVTALDLPEERSDGVWKIAPGRAGLETLLLVVRQTPLSEAQLEEAARTFHGLQPLVRTGSLDEVAWFENGKIVTQEPERGPVLTDILTASNPVLVHQAELHRRVALFEPAYTRTVTFGNRGSN